MAYSVDPQNGDLIINGFEKGIGESPYQGLTDVKNVNVSSVPGEASVAFSTTAVQLAPTYGTPTSNALSVAVNGDQATLLLTGLNAGSFIEANQAFTVSGSSISGLTNGTLFYVLSAVIVSQIAENIGVTTVYGGTQPILTFGTTGTASLSIVPLVLGPRGRINKNYYQLGPGTNGSGVGPTHWLADSNGRVWSDIITTQGGTAIAVTNSWTYTGNTVDSSSFGNGLVYYSTVGSNGLDGWIFLWRQGQIDYLKIMANNTLITAGSLSWVYNWKSSLTVSTYYGNTVGYSHEAIVTPLAGQGVVFCDGFTMGAFFQNNFLTAFDPQTASTYTYFGGPTGASAGFDILAADDIAQCCSYVNGLLFIGGQKNVVYSWDLKSNSPTSFIFLPENDIRNILTVRQNIYIFPGFRGRIYISNGSQADLWKKVPDHISGTIQPNLNWGAAAYALDKIFFGVYNTASGSVFPSSTNKYGGVWAVDLNTGAMFMQNLLSDAVYTGYAAMLGQMGEGEFRGFGLYAGWYDSTTSSGIDVSQNKPYVAGQSVIVSDCIPVGTTIQPITPAQFEYKLSMPLLSTESVELQVASGFNDYVNATFTSLGTTSGSSTATIISDIFPNKIQTQQWLLVKAILTSRANSPSYVRLTEMRVKGATLSKSTMTGFTTE